MRQIYLGLAVLLFCLPEIAHAGAWTQPAGDGQLILSSFYYNTDHMFTNRGDEQHQPDFSKYELNPYLEYGVTNWLTLGANLALDDAHQDGSSTSSQNNFDVGTSELFLRTRLWQGDGFVLSAQPMLDLPSPENHNAQPRLSSSQPDAGIGLLGGYGFDYFGLHHYIDIESSYLYRFGPPTNQVAIDATLGIALTQRLTLMPQLFTTLRTSRPANMTFTNSSADDYDLVQGQLSLLYAINTTTSVQIGGFDNFTGRNVGSGEGALVALWKRF